MISVYLVNPITVHAYSGRDAWGEPAATTEIDAMGYVVWKTRLVRNLAGEEVTSPVHVYLSPLIEDDLGRDLSHEDKIEIEEPASGGERNLRPILSIHRVQDWSGSHLEVNLA